MPGGSACFRLNDYGATEATQKGDRVQSTGTDSSLFSQHKAAGPQTCEQRDKKQRLGRDGVSNEPPRPLERVSRASKRTTVTREHIAQHNRARKGKRSKHDSAEGALLRKRRVLPRRAFL